ncbi:hypothetical protein ACROYT_G032043 [Oculina patagonica]
MCATTLNILRSREETQRDTESSSDDEMISINCASHETDEATAKVSQMDIRKKGTEIYIVVSGYPLVQVGSDSKVLKTKSFSSSSGEEQNAHMCKIKDVEANSHASFDLFDHETKCTKVIFPAMPVIQKCGCMKTSQYVMLITKLKHLQSMGDFVGHEQMIDKEMAKLRLAADPDMEATLQFERAKALYYQNNIKDAKKILKSVTKQEQQLKNHGILVGRALNLLTAIYKRQGKFGNAIECVTMATTCLEDQDSADDKAELHHSYGALLTALPAAKDPEAYQKTKKEAYKYYGMALNGHFIFKKYVHVKMAAMLLEFCSNAGRTVSSLSKEDILKAKKHLDFVEFRAPDNMSLGIGTKIKLLLLRADQYL